MWLSALQIKIDWLIDFPWDEASPISAADSKHKPGNLHVLHSLVSSYPEITVIISKQMVLPIAVAIHVP